MRVLFALLLFWLPLTASAQSSSIADYLDDVLEAVVQPDGSVCYSALTEGPAREALGSALRGIKKFDPAGLDTDAEKLAFWSNAYNALMLDAVSRYPNRSNVLGDDEGRTFFKTPMSAGGLMLTLDELENVILRKQDTDRPQLRRLQVGELDPRLHVALNCAAVSCPPLQRAAFRASTLDQTLDRAFAAWVNDPDHFTVQNGTLVASSLIDWFGSDFDSDQPAGDFLLSHMSEERDGYAALKSKLEGRTSSQIKAAGARYVYDWTVNRARSCR